MKMNKILTICLFSFIIVHLEAQNSNLALTSTATQSSDLGGFPASNAINNIFNDFNHTQAQSEAWLHLDLGAVYQIDTILMYNPTQAPSARMLPFYVFLSDNVFSNTTVATTLAQSGVSNYYYTTYNFNTIDFRAVTNRTGRYIRLQLQNNNFNAFAEVVVKGRAIPTCTDADADGICAPQDCNDNNSAVGAKGVPNASCNDSNAKTTGDRIAQDSCACIADLPISSCWDNAKWVQNAGVTISTNTLTKTAATGLNNSGATSNQVLPANVQVGCIFRVQNLAKAYYIGFSGETITTNNNVSSIIAGLQININNSVDYIENGVVHTTNVIPSIAVGDSIKITRSNTIDIYKNKVFFFARLFDVLTSKHRVLGVLNTNGATLNDVVLLSNQDFDWDRICVDTDCPNDNNSNLPATVGSSCNDGNAQTTNDVIQAGGCTCAGVADTDSDGVPNTTDNCISVSNSTQTNADADAFGAACDCNDNNASIGTQQTVGTACNDNNSTTINDVIQSDGCTCAGTLTCIIDSIRLKTVECFSGGHGKYSNVITAYTRGGVPQTFDVKLDSLPYIIPIQKFYGLYGNVSWMTFDPFQVSNNVRVEVTLTGGQCTGQTLTQTLTYTNATCNN